MTDSVETKGRWVIEGDLASYFDTVHHRKLMRCVHKRIRDGRLWKPAVAYCRYADDFVLIVKGNKAQADAIREECHRFLEDVLSLSLNMEKTHITHVNDGFIISIPRDKARK